MISEEKAGSIDQDIEICGLMFFPFKTRKTCIGSSEVYPTHDGTSQGKQRFERSRVFGPELV